MPTNKTTVTVRAIDLAEHERVILSLIFAVSHRSALRQFAYTLVDGDTPADLVLRDPRGTSPVPEAPVLLVTDTARTSGEPVILRPLIATRVLTVLDDCAVERMGTAPPILDAVPPAVNHDAAIAATEPDAIAEEESDPVREVANTMSAMDSALLSDEIVVYGENPQHVEATQRKRVLVVDDSSAVRKQVEIELVHFDADVDFAASARQALQMLDASVYEVVFLDVVLPDMDGYQICKRIKSKSRDTRVIMLTGKATTEDKLKGTLAGCDAYLVKPVGRQTFQTTVKSFLSLSSGARELKL